MSVFDGLPKHQNYARVLKLDTVRKINNNKKTYVIFCLNYPRHWARGLQSAGLVSQPWSTSCEQTRTESLNWKAKTKQKTSFYSSYIFIVVLGNDRNWLRSAMGHRRTKIIVNWSKKNDVFFRSLLHRYYNQKYVFPSVISTQAALITHMGKTVIFCLLSAKNTAVKLCWFQDLSTEAVSTIYNLKTRLLAFATRDVTIIKSFGSSIALQFSVLATLCYDSKWLLNW